MTYYSNGNIKTLGQYGMKGTTIDWIDRLTYSYRFSNYSDNLMGVADASNDVNTALGDFNYNTALKTSIDYNYDNNSNTIVDVNKGIRRIYYNHMNLPKEIGFWYKGTYVNKGTIKYTYDATGRKLAKDVLDGVSASATTTLYMDEFIYQQKCPIASPRSGIDTLQMVMHEEGRARLAYHKYLNGNR